MSVKNCDLAILGGGLAGGLLAMALAKRQPDVRLLLIEEAETFGGDHVWSFFANDIPDDAKWLVDPLICYDWNEYSVRFPKLKRTLGSRYHSILSDHFDTVIREKIPADQYLTNASVVSHDETSVELADGTRIEAAGVIDARGGGNVDALTCGWQKFTGQLLECEEPHGLEHPIVMDATVEQRDGYRFVYCLPFSPTEVFVEDTYYSDGSKLDPRILRQRIAQYADEQGWKVKNVLREEKGVLPVVFKGDYKRFRKDNENGVALAGSRAGLFHCLTSYSLPDAVRFAMHISALDTLDSASLARASSDFAAKHWRQGWYYRLLGKFLFIGAEPDQRYGVFQRFYGLSEKLIERFYAGQSTRYDKARILTGEPPMPISRAIKALFS
ncbi:lycopene beta-cyclase CrtY [Alterisphingorhabdus coralli]|uniref:Lycopene beta-cyclase CrtY n=1 Tax=Alterisphingorhabdus coralli TaxID=3071408 RepID=A0AA97F7V1_9SPHN|nr:lycopene beta-cyclase CrtY [Parasphingorhabdus sp. SCSIO 66989]WOE74887.1 lycopene beta-cyclase CrtY [Parasphingorhabdus sp. SCSIO 66989]